MSAKRPERSAGDRTRFGLLVQWPAVKPPEKPVAPMAPSVRVCGGRERINGAGGVVAAGIRQWTEATRGPLGFPSLIVARRYCFLPVYPPNPAHRSPPSLSGSGPACDLCRCSKDARGNGHQQDAAVALAAACRCALAWRRGRTPTTWRRSTPDRRAADAVERSGTL